MSSSAAAESGWYKNELKFNKFSYQMTIDNFSHRIRWGILASDTFCVGDDQDTKWRLELNPFYNNGSNYHVYIFLSLFEPKKDVRAKFKFSIVGEKVQELGGSELYSFSRSDNKHGQHIAREVLLDEKNGLLPNDTLTVVCELHVLVDTVVTRGQQSPVNVEECHLSNDFAQLLHSQNFSDCTLSVRGNEFKVHKNILAARSPVFAAMFKHGMKEMQQDRIDISDIEPEVMQELINFIYTGNAPKLGEMAMQLLGAADKYQLGRLKNMCENAMYASITPANACEMLVVSHLHSANQLKTHAIRSINANADKVVRSEGWNQMVKNYPQLIADVFEAKNSKSE